MPEKFNPNAFSTFLEAVKTVPPSSISEPSSLVILKTLAGATGREMRVSDLLAQTNMPITLLASTLQQLEFQKLIESTLIDGNEVVEITNSGLELANL